MPMRVKKLRDLVIIPKQKDFTIEPNDLIKVDQQKLFCTSFWTKSKVEWQFILWYRLALPLAYGVEGYALKTVLLSKQKVHNTRKRFLKMYVLHLGIIEYQLRFCPCCTKIISKYVLLWKAVFGDQTVEPGGLLVTKQIIPK
jgi:hypothetical protein